MEACAEVRNTRRGPPAQLADLMGLKLAIERWAGRFQAASSVLNSVGALNSSALDVEIPKTQS
jgi:hypothetical protein